MFFSGKLPKEVVAIRKEEEDEKVRFYTRASYYSA